MPRKTSTNAEKHGSHWLSPAEAADRTGLSAKWLRELAKKEGLPREPGRAGRYPWPAIREWLDHYREQKLVEKLQPASWKDERAMHTRVRRQIAELELRKRQGELVEVEDALRITNAKMDQLRAVLLAIPATWTPEIIGLGKTTHRRMAAKLTELRDRLMTCLSKTTLEKLKP